MTRTGSHVTRSRPYKGNRWKPLRQFPGHQTRCSFIYQTNNQRPRAANNDVWSKGLGYDARRKTGDFLLQLPGCRLPCVSKRRGRGAEVSRGGRALTKECDGAARPLTAAPARDVTERKKERKKHLDAILRHNSHETGRESCRERSTSEPLSLSRRTSRPPASPSLPAGNDICPSRIQSNRRPRSFGGVWSKMSLRREGEQIHWSSLEHATWSCVVWFYYLKKI